MNQIDVSELLQPGRGGLVAASPESVGWERVSFSVDRLSEGDAVSRDTGPQEVALVPLCGTVQIETEDAKWRLGSRKSVFTGLPEALYLPRGLAYTITAKTDVEVASCGARAEESYEPRLITSNDYRVELRGAGNASRQVVTLIPPEFPADRLLVVEVWTPSGNWSSYPPHKHDEARPPEEARLEETYYYRLSDTNGFALQRLYSPVRNVNETWGVRDGDLFIVPWGYHTTVAAPGYDLYYLNVLAGDARELTPFEDPEHVRVKDGWRDQATDPRLPLVR
jgi:5-deoxy-glucuronate isomerase